MKIRFTRDHPIGADRYREGDTADLHPAFGWRLIHKGVAAPVSMADVRELKRQRKAWPKKES